MANLLADEEYLIIEKASVPCSFFHKFPRHRKFISANKSRNLRLDWNSFLGDYLSFRDYSEELYPHVDDYLKYVNDFVKLRNIKIRYNFEVTSLEKKDELFFINNGEYTATRVFFGIGIVPKKPCYEVNSSMKVFTYADMPIDKEVYRDKNIIVIGSGNAAFETVKWLEPYVNKIKVIGKQKLAYLTHYPGHLRSVNFSPFDSYHLKLNTHIAWDNYQNRHNNVKNNSFMSGYFHILIYCHGFEFDNTLVKELVKVDKYPILTPHFESTECKNLFFIGSNSQQEDYKHGTSAFIHGFRYNCQYISRYLKNTIKCEKMLTRTHVLTTLLGDLTESSALLHRFDFFCNIVGFHSNIYEYISEVPVKSVNYYFKKHWKCALIIKFGYINKVPNVVPIFSYIKNPDEKIDEMYLHETPYNEFNNIYYYKTLNYYFKYVEGMYSKETFIKLSEKHEKSFVYKKDEFLLDDIISFS